MQITSVECLDVFVELLELDLSGCNRISTESLVALSQSRLKLAAPGHKKGTGTGDFLYETLTELGRYTDAMECMKKKLEIAQQTGKS